MHYHIKIPNRKIPIKRICKKINDKNKKNKEYQAFCEFLSVHYCIISFLKENTPRTGALLRTISDVLP